MTLDDLGPRICIMGPSNSGKSTLAAAIGRTRGLPPVYLDQLHHLPNTDWQPRPVHEFIALHDAAIQEESWVMDGDYTRCLPQRLARATGVILLDTPAVTSLFRYLRRTVLERDRHGAPEGRIDSVKWEMIRHIMFVSPKNRRRYEDMFTDDSPPKVRLSSVRDVGRFYRLEGLRR